MDEEFGWRGTSATHATQSTFIGTACGGLRRINCSARHPRGSRRSRAKASARCWCSATTTASPSSSTASATSWCCTTPPPSATTPVLAALPPDPAHARAAGDDRPVRRQRPLLPQRRGDARPDQLGAGDGRTGHRAARLSPAGGPGAGRRRGRLPGQRRTDHRPLRRDCAWRSGAGRPPSPTAWRAPSRPAWRRARCPSTARPTPPRTACTNYGSAPASW